MRPSIDNTPPPAFTHLQRNMKKAQMEEGEGASPAAPELHVVVEETIHCTGDCDARLFLSARAAAR